MGAGDGSSGRRKRNARSRWQKQPLSQVRRPSNAVTVTEYVAQGSDCTVTAGAAATRTGTIRAHNPLSLETEGTGRQHQLSRQAILGMHVHTEAYISYIISVSIAMVSKANPKSLFISEGRESLLEVSRINSTLNTLAKLASSWPRTVQMYMRFRAVPSSESSYRSC